MNVGKVCASISAETSSEAVIKIKNAEAAADLIEVRFDHLRDDELPALIEFLRDNRTAKSLIATYRAPDQGGRGPGPAEERAEFWKKLDIGCWAVDLEEDIFDTCREGPTRILSFHDFERAGDNANETFERLRGRGAEIVKYACLADDITDTIPVWKMLRHAEKTSQPTVAIAMGEAGKITRILGPAHGSKWSYGSIGTETAPGQISVVDLNGLYRMPHLDRQTRVYGVIGDPVSASRSPKIHNAAFGDAGLNAVFVPLLVKDIGQFMKRMVRPASREVDLNLGGFAVTMPLKLSIIGHLDEIDETAQAIGAVNTVLIDNERLLGFNTDAEGFISPLLARVEDLKGVNAAIFGAGGAARACAFALKKHGASVTILARDPVKAARIADEFGTDSNKIGAEELRSFDIVVNATPIGMNGIGEGTMPFDTNGLENVKIVYDLVTSADPTPLVRAARNAGVETIMGVEMLVAQAVRQFEIWTGKPAPVTVMKNAARPRSS